MYGQFLRVLALCFGFGGWAIVAIVFYWVESNGGTASIHNNRIWPPFERIGDVASIALAFTVIASALVYEVVSHLKQR